MKTEYWFRKMRGNPSAIEIINSHLSRANEADAEAQDKSLRELMDAVEPHGPKTPGESFTRFIKAVVDEVAAGNEQRIHEAIRMTQEGHRGGFIKALEKIRIDHHRWQVERMYPDSQWTETIHDRDIGPAYRILISLAARKIAAKTIDEYVRNHPYVMASTRPPENATAVIRDLARRMEKRPAETLALVVEKMRKGQAPSNAWKETNWELQR